MTDIPDLNNGRVSLREYIEAILHEQDRALIQLAASQERALQALAAQQAREVFTLAESTEREVQTLAAAHAREVQELKANVLELARLHSEAHAREHNLSQTAVEKAEVNVNDRLAEMNKTFLARLDALASAGQLYRETMLDRVALIEKKDANLDGRFWALGVGLAILVVVINIAMKFLG